MNKIKRKIKYLFTSAIMLLFVFLNLNSSSAATSTPSQSFFTAGSAPQYISVVYTWGSMMVGALSVVVIAIAGINYMRSMGNPEVISQSKTLISGALIGLFLVLGGYMLLRLIDPRFVDLKITIPKGGALSEAKIALCDDESAFPTCTKDEDCPIQCSYGYRFCETDNLADLTDSNTDDTKRDLIDIKCVNGKCGKAKGGFCGIMSYGDSSSASAECEYCDDVKEYTFSHLCPSGTTCKKDDLVQFPNICEGKDVRPYWKSCQ